MKKYWLTDEEFENVLPKLKEQAGKKEEWKIYPTDISVEVSNCGRIRQNGQILPMTEVEDGYLYVSTKNFKAKVYRLVAENWCINADKPSAYDTVHHIDNNGYNNTPENLIWVNKEQHSQIHSIK